MVYRMESTLNKIVDTIGIKNIGAQTTGHTVPPGIIENGDLSLMLEFFSHSDKR